MGRLSSMATRLISKYGRAIEIIQAGEPIPDGMGGTEPGPETTHDAVGVSATYAVELQMIAGGMLGAGDQRVLVAVDGLSITPTTNDRVRMEGAEYYVERVSPLAPDGEPLFWELQVRNA